MDTLNSGSSAERIANWLLSHEAVLQNDDTDGMVVNWRDDNGDWEGGYPEIAGYYLQFLSQLADSQPDRTHLSEMAARVGSWLDRVSRKDPPLTRYTRHPDQFEWRNEAVFSFDLAMIVRGAVLATNSFPNAIPGPLLARFGGWVSDMQANGLLLSHRRRLDSGQTLPEKWSTQADVHHVKTAAALHSWGDPDAQALARRSADPWLERLELQGGLALMGDFHPYLYMIEGLLLLYSQTQQERYLAGAGEAYDALLDVIEPSGQSIPDRLHGAAENMRSDVIAQTLRVGTVFLTAGRLDADRWARLSSTLKPILLNHITTEGAVLFSTKTGHRNTWASMFAWQALDMERRAEAGQSAAEMAARLI